METQPIVAFTDFFFRYSPTDPFALSCINLEIFPGQIILLGGPSGSGKSTLCHAIAGRIPFDISGQMKGEINLFGKSIWEYTPEDIPKRVAYLFQNPEEQLVTFTVFDEIAFALENYCEAPNEIKARVFEIAEKLRITKLLKKSIYALSGGEKQKVILAANLVLNPEILILDEPLAFLDEEGEGALIEFLKAVHESKPNLTIIIIEHRLNPFEKLLNSILVLNEKGEIIFNGTQIAYQRFSEQQHKQYIRDDYKLKTEINETYQNSAYLQAKSLENPSKKNNSPIISLQNVQFEYENGGSKVFHNFSLDIQSNEFLGIVGSNGSGKTTLLYLMANVLKPVEGKIQFNGNDYNSLRRDEFYPNIGFIFQNPESQIFETSVKREILYGIENFTRYGKNPEKFAHLNEATIISQMIPLISEARVSEHSLVEQNPFCLSWGQKRRLNLASIFAYEPEILLIDEPFIGQDALAVRRIFEILVGFHKSGKTVVIVSHDRDLLKAYCTRIIDINQIKIRKEASPADIQKNPNQLPKKGLAPDYSSKKTRRISRLKNLLLMQDSDRNRGWLFQINAVVKLIAVLLLTTAIFFQKSILLMGLLLFLFLLVSKSTNIPPSSILYQIRIIIVLTIIYIPINAIFDASTTQDSEILFYLGADHGLPVRRIALYYAIRTGLLILNLLASAILFIRTTNLKDLTYGLMQLKIPYRIAFAFMIGLRYVPLIAMESNTIEIAQTLRGVKLRKGVSVKTIFYFIVQRLTTLLISVLRKSKTTASAIEARGFGYQNKRTNLHQIKWTVNDITYLIILIIISTFLISIGIGIMSTLAIPSLFDIYQKYFAEYICQIFRCE